MRRRQFLLCLRFVVAAAAGPRGDTPTAAAEAKRGHRRSGCEFLCPPSSSPQCLVVGKGIGTNTGASAPPHAAAPPPSFLLVPFLPTSIAAATSPMILIACRGDPGSSRDLCSRLSVPHKRPSGLPSRSSARILRTQKECAQRSALTRTGYRDSVQRGHRAHRAHPCPGPARPACPCPWSGCAIGSCSCCGSCCGSAGGPACPGPLCRRRPRRPPRATSSRAGTAPGPNRARGQPRAQPLRRQAARPRRRCPQRRASPPQAAATRRREPPAREAWTISTFLRRNRRATARIGAVTTRTLGHNRTHAAHAAQAGAAQERARNAPPAPPAGGCCACPCCGDGAAGCPCLVGVDPGGSFPT